MRASHTHANHDSSLSVLEAPLLLSAHCHGDFCARCRAFACAYVHTHTCAGMLACTKTTSVLSKLCSSHRLFPTFPCTHAAWRCSRPRPLWGGRCGPSVSCAQPSACCTTHGRSSSCGRSGGSGPGSCGCAEVQQGEMVRRMSCVMDLSKSIKIMKVVAVAVAFKAVAVVQLLLGLWPWSLLGSSCNRGTAPPSPQNQPQCSWQACHGPAAIKNRCRGVRRGSQRGAAASMVPYMEQQQQPQPHPQR